MIVKTIPSTWLVEEEHRLDCGPFVKGGIEARKKIEGLRCKKDHLVNLTKDGINGMYHVGQDKIVWAENNIHGMPFLRSADILKTDLSSQPFISKRQVAGNYLFQCPEGTTLITRSGTIGRMAYMRSDMVDMAISQDVLKVVPDTEKVNPGYLYAFLSSRYGIPIITGGTFGSIIVHIEAENIAKLPVPRLELIEDKVHDLVQMAAHNRAQASLLIANAIATVHDDLEIPLPNHEPNTNRPSITTQSSRLLLKRMDSFFYSEENVEARNAFDSAGKRHGVRQLGDVADVWIPDIFKRLYVDDPRFGSPYFTGKEIYEIAPTTNLFLKREIAENNRLLLSAGMILIQDSGQVSGLIGRPVMVGKHLNGAACTNNMVRVTSTKPTDIGYIFAILSTVYGIRLLKREASGSSIPHLEESRIRRLSIPWPGDTVRKAIGGKIVEAMNLRDAAMNAEDSARTLIERTIEEGGC